MVLAMNCGPKHWTQPLTRNCEASMSTNTAMALCFSLAYIVALVGLAAALIRKPTRKP